MPYLRSLLFVAAAMIISICATAQTANKYYPQPAHSEWFKAIPLIDNDTPEWAITMYNEDDNWIKIEKLKEIYYKDHKWEKNIHVQNYKHWRKIVQNHIDDNGRVSLPDPIETFKKHEAAKRNRSETSTRSANSWINIGPDNTVSSGESRPTQAHVNCIEIAPSNHSTLYAGMATGGVFKSTDKGLTWNPSSWDYAFGSPNDIKVDHFDENIAYVTVGSAIYKTTDGGITWILSTSPGGIIEQLYIHTVVTDTIYAATRTGIYKSNDAGATWSTKYSGYIYDIEAKPNTNDTFYIAVKNDITIRPEIMISYDSGENWVLKDSGFYSPTDLSVATVYGCKIGVTPADPDRIYAGIIATGKEGDNGYIGIYHSMDIGETWQNESGVDGAPIDDGDGTWSYPSGNDMNTNWYVAGYSSGYHQGWYNFDLDVSHNDADRVWMGTIWVTESGNKGGNIEYIRGTRNLSMHADVQDIEVVGDDIWWASDGGLNYSNDECQTMETRMLGMSASDFWGFGQGWNEDIWAGGRYHNGDAAYHENYGKGNTMFLGGAEQGTGYVNQLDNRKMYFSDIGDKKIPTELNDIPENIANLGLYPTESYFDFEYSEVEWHPFHANTIFVGKDDKLYQSKDGGSTFNSIHTFGGDIRRYEMSRENPDYIYAIVYHSYWDWRVERSTDGGITFTELAQPTLSGGSWRNLSFTLNPFDKDEIWLASNSSSDGNKIFRSIDGGNTWTNHYASEISGHNIKDMIYHANTVSDKVYVMTNDNYFSYDIDLDIWESYNDGLPVTHTGFMSLPFYRDSKIRMASAKGIWETTFENPTKVQSIPMINKDSLLCVRDTSQLESYSIIDQDGAAWAWSITPAPLYISDATARNPKVVFGAEGDYDITLTITAADGQSDTRTIEDMVNVSNYCTPDNFNGKALKTTANGQHVVMRDADLENITHFTVTGWWKPDGAQQAYSSLVSSGDWCAHCDYTEGLVYDYYGSRLWYKWPGNSSNWASNSGIEIPQNEWSYVALVITPEGATMYLNDEKYYHQKALQPGNITDLYIAYGHYSKSFKGEIDEVTIWNTALTDDEVRRLRHITKEDELETNPNLIAYYQFNETVNGNNIMDMAGSRHGVLHQDATLVESTAPIGGGSSEIINLDASITEYDIAVTGSKIYISDCEEPNGQLVMTKIEMQPDTLATTNINPEEYWIINHYSDDDALLTLDSIELISDDIAFISSLGSEQDAVVHTRSENDYTNNWITRARAKSLSGNTIVYDRISHITGDIQISLSNGAPSILEIDPGKPCEVDTIPGFTLALSGSSDDYASIPNLDLNTNTLTMSAWIKPDGIQNDWAGILFARGGTTISGLSIRDDNELRYHWNGGEWGWSSGAYVELDKWNHVALVIEPTQMHIYINGVPYTRTTNHTAEAFDTPIRIGADTGSSSRRFDGQVDEVCIWNRALTQGEIRSLRHLTKDDIINTDEDLEVYLQFNEMAGNAYDKTTNRANATLNGNAGRILSSAPIGGGESEGYNVTGPVTITSIVTGVDIDFGGSGKYPDGEIMISRINVEPDTLASISPISSSYWIINNYGSNQNISTITKLKLNNAGNLTSNSMASEYKLVSRKDNDFGLLWVDEITADILDINDKSLTFDTPISISTLGQFAIDNRGARGWIGVQDTNWNNANNWGGGIIPSATDEVVIPARVPFFPEVELNVNIESLLMQPGSYIQFKSGNTFDANGE